MRTEDQIKKKINELVQRAIDAELEYNKLHEEFLEGHKQHQQRLIFLAERSEHFRNMANILEWVLDAPTGRYHV